MAEQNVALQPPQVEQPVEIDEDNLPLGQFITLLHLIDQAIYILHLGKRTFN